MYNHYKFITYPCKYQVRECEPWLSAQDLQLNYSIYQDCTDKLNIAVCGFDFLKNLTPEELLYARLPRAIESDVRRYAASYIVHSTYFATLSPCRDGVKMPCGKLREKIIGNYVSAEGFFYEIKRAATGLCGCGTVWLLTEKNGEITIAATPDYDFPDLRKYKVLCCFDFWEHAYVARYGCNRAAYCDALMKLTDFRIVSKRYDKYTGNIADGSKNLLDKGYAPKRHHGHHG